MFHHVKELQFNARVSRPDYRFAAMLLEQFGGPNGELKAAMQYFVQAFAAKRPHPDKYDLLMDIATEEFSHLEIVGATVTMLLDGITGDLKNAAEQSELMQMLQGNERREELIQGLVSYPQFFALTGGGPRLTDSNGNPWMGVYVNANGDLTVDLRSNIAAESRAKIVYEYLLQFTEDPYVQDSLRFLMTREVTHFQQFNAALASIEPNFPPGVLQGSPQFTHVAFNMSSGNDARGPWNEGQGTWAQGEWFYVEDPIDYVHETNGLVDEHPIRGTTRSPEDVQQLDQKLSQHRSQQITEASPGFPQQWSDYRRPAAARER
jgi:Mn-containing catalase